MTHLYARTVFFVADAPRALDFYTKTLGFNLDWTYEEKGLPFVFQVSLFGFELIINQVESGRTEARPGHGRVFIGLEPKEAVALAEHIASHRIETTDCFWGAPTMAIHDLDRNELFFWLPQPENRQEDSAGTNDGQA